MEVISVILSPTCRDNILNNPVILNYLGKRTCKTPIITPYFVGIILNYLNIFAYLLAPALWRSE
jgi:hypothetical protein